MDINSLNSKVVLQENVSLKIYNTFGIDVTTKYFIEVKSLDELQSVLKFSVDSSLPILIVGGGSNIFILNETPTNVTTSITANQSIFNPSNLTVVGSSVFFIAETADYYVLGDLINSGSIIVSGSLKIGGALLNSGSITGPGSIT
jgi:hypothetical protein